MAEHDLQPALDAAQNQLNLTFSASDSLDTKALAILAFDAALGIFGLQSEMHNQWWLLVPFFGCLLASMYATVTVIIPQDYMGAIVNVEEYQKYLNLTTTKLVLQLLADTQEAITHNSQLNLIKSESSIAAIYLSLVAIVFLAGCII